MKPIHCMTAVLFFLCAEARPEQVILPAGTSLKLTDTSILGVCEELAKHIGGTLHIVDYGVLFEMPLASAAGTGKDRANPFEQK